MPELSVRECMHEGVISCTEDTGIEEVAREMSTHRISALVVVEGGVAVGVISQTDLVNATFVQPYLHHWPGMAARHLMSKPVVSVRPDAPLAAALELLRSRRIHRLVVTEVVDGGERPVGILSMTDVVRMLGERGAREVS
ncbi:MAG: hypothetical protein A3E31_18465 [Candidatus Rokubacteria bacterium RIFCSPHIGHO2_12_FULL_73_22]|nr:MAG: hypothetical protein A3D33_03585 [Candidatus Rokubacteria bacterium RIFCSPHIGHO2_02_FULL_73_26]OGL00864.1 MAG: hypothetical protein A3E31_18465 [Candidatus Rokubacteria bacterium RIFCSPHIGHO2_12_FULL_73_22]OGL08859.1 MAG: hypothetical protein A3I14_06670 [Candidatus Rokubacteria bacterium RIFCSPLOWO2_02_FULL_73_56]OGL30148.1 MAG: hypothetical protein A3G44_00685 [Candidatus Rokubacteria bacterium RIFCSPLOWO2_12_FULL_73_47]